MLSGSYLKLRVSLQKFSSCRILCCQTRAAWFCSLFDTGCPVTNIRTAPVTTRPAFFFIQNFSPTMVVELFSFLPFLRFLLGQCHFPHFSPSIQKKMIDGERKNDRHKQGSLQKQGFCFYSSNYSSGRIYHFLVLSPEITFFLEKPLIKSFCFTIKWLRKQSFSFVC